VSAVQNKKFINGMGIHRSGEHCLDIAIGRYKKTPKVLLPLGFLNFV
jgi:hypothetical protein